jgi:hypothetical protein
MYGTQLLGHLGDHAVDLLPAGDVGHEGKNAPVGLAAKLAGSCLQISLIPGNDRHLDPFPGQLSCDGFADTSTTARYEGPLALQSEVHGSFSPLSARQYSGPTTTHCCPIRKGAQVRRQLVRSLARRIVMARTGVWPLGLH